MSTKIELMGHKFGRLLVLEDTGERRYKRVVWKCLCDPKLGGCGKVVNAISGSLRSGGTRSCGCLRKGLRVKDLAGQRFGRLRVLEEVSERRRGRVVWKCLCDPEYGGCGNTVTRSSDDLQCGGTRSCGCSRNRTIDLAGHRFGRLIVLEKTNKRCYGHVVWKCLCSSEQGGCGNITHVSAGALRNGNTRSCGCLAREPKIKDRAGQRFGRLVALEMTDRRDESGAVMWKCQCDCGNQALVSGALLHSGGTRSCGCYREECKRITASLPRGVAARNKIMTQYKAMAKKRKHEWGLSENDFDKLIQSNCFYCGVPPHRIARATNGNRAYTGIDRIDSSRGYTRDNVVPCCTVCNHAKTDMSLKNFIAWAVRLHDHTGAMLAPGRIDRISKVMC